MATTADVALVDAALKELEVHCGLGLDPSVKLRDDQAILIHNAACKLGEACTQHVLEHTSPVRVQLLEKIHVRGGLQQQLHNSMTPQPCKQRYCCALWFLSFSNQLQL